MSGAHPDGGLGLQVELVLGEPGEQVGLADTRVTNQDGCGARQKANARITRKARA